MTATAIRVIKQAARRLQPPSSQQDGLYVAATAFLLFTLITHLATLASGATGPPRHPELQLGPAARFIASRAAALWMARLTSTLYAFGSGEPLRTGSTSKPWKRSAATALLHAELLAAAFSSVVPMLRSLPAALLPVAAAACFCLGPALLRHSEVACRLGPVVAVAEGAEVEGWKGGAAALQRAERVVEGRKVEGFLLAAAATALERAVPGDAASLVGVPLHLAAKFVAYFAYTAFYHDCRRRIAIGNKNDSANKLA